MVIQSPRPGAGRRALLFATLAACFAPAPPAAASGATVADGVEIGVRAYRYRYVEPGLMELEGNKAGLRAAYARTDEAGRHGRLEFLAGYGRLRYNSQNTGSIDKVPDAHAEVRLLVGHDFGPGRGLALLPYFGIGYRYLHNDLRGTSTTGALGYRRESNYLYAPVGLDARWKSLAMNLELDLLISGRQTSYLSDTGLGLSDVNNSQRRGLGGRASIAFDAGKFSVGPWIAVWHIEDSEFSSPAPGLIGLEPRNRTTEAGLELRVRY